MLRSSGDDGGAEGNQILTESLSTLLQEEYPHRRLLLAPRWSPTLRKRPTQLYDRNSVEWDKFERIKTYTSAQSKLSLTTPSDSPHHIQTLCHKGQYSLSNMPAFSFSPSAAFPVRSAREFLGDEDEGALELGEDLNPVSAPAPRSLCAALLC